MDTVDYYAKPLEIKAVQVTRDNMLQLASEIGAAYIESMTDMEARLEYYGVKVRIGDWYVPREFSLKDFSKGKSMYDVVPRLFYSDEEFKEKYWTHENRMAEDTKYAMIYQLVRGAMSKQDVATYYGDNTGMHQVACETVKKIMGEL